MLQDGMSGKAFVQANYAFAFDLYKKLKEREGNLFFSPYSISAALAMTYAGARETTAVQMSQVLHFPLDHNQLHPQFASLQAKLEVLQKMGSVRLRAANSLWPQVNYPFLEAFLSLVREYYGVTITPLDYAQDAEAARRTINSWVKEKTGDKIENLIPTGILDAMTRLVLTNAIYFKGNWAYQFDRRLTKNAPFSVGSGKQVTVPMMMELRECRYAENDHEQILELPYAGGELSMLVLLPREVDGLAELEDSLVREGLARRKKELLREEVAFYLPRFEVMSYFEMDDVLITMGMPDAFDAMKADFSGMDGKKEWLYIAKALHKAFINVNEEGSEAAAATAISDKIRGIPPLICADHPFVFLICENSTGSILFLGRVVNPVSSGA